MTASNVGYGADLYQQGITEYQKQNNGSLPATEERQRIAMHAAGAVAAEQAGEMVGVSAMKVKGAFKGASSEVTKTEEAVRTGFKQSLLNVPKAAGEGLISEAPTEAYQTYAEGEATLKPATAKDIYIGGAIGGIAGAGLTGGGRALAEGAQATPEHAVKRGQDTLKKEEQIKAMEANDPTAYLDPKSPTYDTTKGLQVLYGHSTLDTATPETRKANLEQANKVVADLGLKRDALREITPEGIAENKQFLAQQESVIASSTDANEVSAAKSMVEMLKTTIADAEARTPSQKKASINQLASLDRQLAEAQPLNDSLHQLVHGPSLDAAVELANTVPDATDEVAVTAHKEAVDHIITLSMAAPENISPEVASSLAKNMDNGLTEDQRSHLRSFSDARVAENKLKTMSKVSQDVYFGSTVKGQIKYVGLAQYNKQMGAAIAAGNEGRAKQVLASLTKFATDHQAKAAIAQQALDTVRGRPAQIVRNQASGVWEISPKVMSRADVQKNGGLTLTREDGSVLSVKLTVLLSTVNPEDLVSTGLYTKAVMKFSTSAVVCSTPSKKLVKSIPA